MALLDVNIRYLKKVTYVEKKMNIQIIISMSCIANVIMKIVD